MFEIIKASLGRGEPVKIAGFGSFVVRTKHSRKGRNPTTGAEILISGHKVLAFKASPIIFNTQCSDWPEFDYVPVAVSSSRGAQVSVRSARGLQASMFACRRHTRPGLTGKIAAAGNGAAEPSVI
jgi:hypothetical protein